MSKLVLCFLVCFWLVGTAGTCIAVTAKGPSTPICVNTLRDPPACRETRMVSAADQLNRLTQTGIIVSAAGTFALVVTVFFTAMAARAATTAAVAAKDAVDHARSTAALEYRPYAVPQLGIVHWHSEDTNHTNGYSLNLHFKNVGKTPAVNIVSYSNLHYSKEPVSAEFDFPTVGLSRHSGIIAMGDTLVVQGGFMPLTFWQEVYRGEMCVLLYGWIEYSALNSDARFRTEYATHVTINFDPACGDTSVFSAGALDYFNGIDETCYRKPSNSVRKWTEIKPTKPPEPVVWNSSSNITTH